ncbi:MAG: iron-containing alcohol dehydrogenase, partial [Verrucomicrobia bacterium]|nr:iron-containing alcohol dehydrogenase [Verrucomicrobiota bacterium]
MTSHGEGFLVPGRFDHAPRTRLVFGPGVSVEVGSAVRAIGGKRALVVTDAGIVKAGHADVILSSLRSAGVEVAIFDRVKENPTTEVVDDCLGVARQQQTDFLVGLGGGSSMDTAKGCNFLLTNGGRMQ